MRKALILSLLLVALVPAAALGDPPVHRAATHRARRAPARGASAARLSVALTRAMAAAGAGSGAYVIDATSGRPLFAWHANTPRILASNTKIFTTTTLLGRYGTGSSLATMALSAARLSAAGVLGGDLFLRGGGDPTFGGRSFARSAYGSNADVEALAAELRADGLRRVNGSVVGDESLFDALRGGPDSAFGVSIYVGPLSALAYDRGLADPSGSAFQSKPPLFAAARFTAALRHAGIHVGSAPRAAPSPPGAVELAEVRSPSLARIVQITDKTSDNFFAETLAKGLVVDGLPGGPLRQPNQPLPPRPVPGGAPTGPRLQLPASIGTTTAGARLAARFAHSLGAQPALVDGSGLSRLDRATPRQLATLLLRVRQRSFFRTFFDALSIAGRDGTLVDRMRSGPASGNCHGKTGTLTGVSALSGYCRARGGRTIVFSILMNRVDVTLAHALQDRMAEAIAGL